MISQGDDMKTRINRLDPLHLELFDRPGRYMADDALHNLVQALTDVAATCFDEVPEYQIMTGTREELSDKIIAVAWREDGTAAGFCSVVLLPVSGYGNILHLGLTCVRPDARGLRLTHRLIKNGRVQLSSAPESAWQALGQQLCRCSQQPRQCRHVF